MNMKTSLLLTILTLSVLNAPAAAIQCANLIYGGTVTSRCFSDEFLSAAQKETTISTERRFKTVKLGSKELFKYPFTVMTGEKDFSLTKAERENLKQYLESGGFLLASAGCSSKDFDQAFRRALKATFPKQSLSRIPMDDVIYRTVHNIEKLDTKSAAGDVALEGLRLNGKTVVVYSREGLNDTPHTEGCCCCGGNEILNSLQVNVNIFIYALLY